MGFMVGGSGPRPHDKGCWLVSRSVEWDDDADGPGAFRRPLPPEDRVWRHPSEVGSVRAAPAPPPPRRSRTWAVALAAGLAGAAAVTLVVAATGGLGGRVVERQVVERLRVAPASLQGAEAGEAGVVAAREVSPAVVRLEVRTLGGNTSGSGVIVEPDGYLVTNAHVVEDALGIDAVLADGRVLAARAVGSDQVTGVAVVKIDAPDLAVAPVGSSAGLSVGEPLVVIGSPLGLAGGPSVTLGVVSALGRRVDPPEADPLYGMIQTDVPIAPGSSGGALVDRRGTVVGLTTAIGTTLGGAVEVGFATPMEVVRDVADDIIRTGAARHGWLGIGGVDLAPAEAESLGVTGGVAVGQLTAGGPAEGAGLLVDDVIVAVGQDPVRSMSDLMAALRRHGPGEAVSVAVVRGEARRAVGVTLGERPLLDAGR